MNLHSNASQNSQTKLELTSRLNRFIGLIGVLVLIVGLLVLRTDFEIVAKGTVTREDEYSVYAPVFGAVDAVYFREGDTVAKGDIVLVLDGNELELRLLAKRREVADLEFRLAANELALKEFAVKPASVEVMVAKDKSRLLGEIFDIQTNLVNRWEELERTRDISTIELQQERIEQLRLELEQLEVKVRANWMEAGAQEIDHAKLELDQRQLKHALELANEEVAVLRKERDRLQLRAPTNGRLTRLDMRYPGLMAEKGQFLFTVADTDSPYIVEALVPERNIDLIQPGTHARMESEVFDSMFEGFILGTVVSVSPDSTNRSDAPGKETYFEVDIRVDSTPLPLVMGSSLKTYLILGKRSLWDLLLDRRGQTNNLRANAEETT